LDNGLTGLCPMFWHLNPKWRQAPELTDREYMAIPASLLCGGVDDSRWRLPFGTSMHGERIANGQWSEHLARFCLNTLPWQYLNRYERVSYDGDEVAAEVRHRDGVVCKADFAKPGCRIEHGSVLIRDDDDVFVPCPWAEGREIVAFSRNGYAEQRWPLPPAWKEAPFALVSRITPEGLQGVDRAPTADGAVKISLPPGQAFSLRAESGRRGL